MMFKLGYRKCFCYPVLLLVQCCPLHSMSSDCPFGIFQQSCTSQCGLPGASIGAAVSPRSSMWRMMHRKGS